METRETRVPRIYWHGDELARYLLAAGVPLELCDYQGDETVVVWRAPDDDTEPPDVAALLAAFMPGPPPPTRAELIAAAATLEELKQALIGA